MEAQGRLLSSQSRGWEGEAAKVIMSIKVFLKTEEGSPQRKSLLRIGSGWWHG